MNRSRGIAIIALMYAMTVLVTIIGFVLLSHSVPVDSRFWISLAGLLLAETLFWTLSGWGALRGQQFASTMPAFMAQMVVAGIYSLLVIGYILILWLLLRVPASLYGWLHLATFFAAVGSIASLSWFMQSERDTDAQERIKKIGIADIRQGLGEIGSYIRNWQEPHRGEVTRLLSQLEESVRFSDPVTHPDVWKEEEQLTQEIHRLRERMMQLPDADEQQMNRQLEQLRQHFQTAHDILRQRNARLAAAKS